MRYIFILLMIISLGSFVLAQTVSQEKLPNYHYYPFTYRNTNNLTVLLNKLTAKLKSSPELKAVIIYNKGYKKNKINFNTFKLKVQNVLIKSNKIEPSRLRVIADIQKEYSSSFDIWIIDREGSPVRDW